MSLLCDNHTSNGYKCSEHVEGLFHPEHINCNSPTYLTAAPLQPEMSDALQTREQFLAQLPQLIDLPDDADEECGICLEEHHQPMAVCEKHIFCRGCIDEWLTDDRNNTCPTCRRVLFAVPNAEEEDDAEDEVLTEEEVFDLIEVESGLSHDTFPRVEIVGVTTAEIHEVVPEARQYLREIRGIGGVPLPNETALLDDTIIGQHLGAMGNILLGHAFVMNRPYTIRQWRAWEIVLEEVRAGLCGYPHKEVTGDELATFTDRFLTSVEEEVRDSVYGEVDDFFEPDPHRQTPAGDLVYLLDYVLFQCITAYQGRDLFDAML